MMNEMKPVDGGVKLGEMPIIAASRAPVRVPVGTRVVLSEAALKNIENGNRSIKHYPSDSFVAKCREICALGDVGTITHIFPPGYDVSIRFDSGDAFHMSPGFFEVVE